MATGNKSFKCVMKTCRDSRIQSLMKHKHYTRGQAKMILGPRTSRRISKPVPTAAKIPQIKKSNWRREKTPTSIRRNRQRTPELTKKEKTATTQIEKLNGRREKTPTPIREHLEKTPELTKKEKTAIPQMKKLNNRGEKTAKPICDVRDITRKLTMEEVTTRSVINTCPVTRIQSLKKHEHNTRRQAKIIQDARTRKRILTPEPAASKLPQMKKLKKRRKKTVKPIREVRERTPELTEEEKEAAIALALKCKRLARCAARKFAPNTCDGED